MPAFAEPKPLYGKLSPDLRKAAKSDELIDVILQFNHPPDDHNYKFLKLNGAKIRLKFNSINGASARIPASMLPLLQAHPEIAYVTPDRPVEMTYDETASTVMADVAAQQFKLDGSGVGVAVVDSGIVDHPDLHSSDDLSKSRVVYGESFVPGVSSSTDQYGHGTHVAGLIAGNGAASSKFYSGIAPGVNILNLRVLDANGAGSDSSVIAAIERAIQLKDQYNVRIINLSLGRKVYESYALDPLCQAVESAWKAGIVVVVAAGNAGRDNTYGTKGYATIAVPGNDPYVITVGADNASGVSSRFYTKAASFSSKGPTLLDHIAKPDLVAPDNRVVSLRAAGSTLDLQYPIMAVWAYQDCSGVSNCQPTFNKSYFRLSGTSMATPVVSGAAALMIQHDPTLSPDQIKARMMKTAWKGSPRYSWAWDSFGISYSTQYTSSAWVPVLWMCRRQSATTMRLQGWRFRPQRPTTR
jgi:serine protease AprX